MADVERNGEEGRITNNPNDPPSSYELTFNRLKSVKDGSSGPGDCFQKFVTVLCGSVSLTMIIVGAIRLKDCPIEHFLPIYLIVGGCFGVVQSLMTMSIRVRNQRNKKEEDNAKLNLATGIVTAFLIAWSIAGSVWVYRIFNTVTTSDPTAATYCHAEIYWFTFILLTSGYVMLAILFCCFWSIAAVAMCLVAAKQSKESDESNESPS